MKKRQTHEKSSKKINKKEGLRGGKCKARYKKRETFEKGTNRLGNLINKHPVFGDLITTEIQTRLMKL